MYYVLLTNIALGMTSAPGEHGCQSCTRLSASTHTHTAGLTMNEWISVCGSVCVCVSVHLCVHCGACGGVKATVRQRQNDKP